MNLENDMKTMLQHYGQLKIQPDSLLELAEDNACWVELQSAEGSIEGKLYLPSEKTSKLIIFEPGFPGGGAADFEKLHVKNVLQANYAVFIVRHNGTILDEQYSGYYINCPERLEKAVKEKQEILGDRGSYTIADWLIEPMIAFKALSDSFTEIILVGHSFGGLALFYSLIELSKHNPKEVNKIKRIVSLAGDTGRIRIPDAPNLKFWHSFIDADWVHKRVQVGTGDENLVHLTNAYKRIHEEAKLIPAHIQLICINPWGDSKPSMDEFICPQEALDIILSLGRGVLIIDKTQFSDGKSGRAAHDFGALKTDMLLKFIDPSWNPSKQIWQIDETGLH